jgi:hypothetical protein
MNTQFKNFETWNALPQSEKDFINTVNGSFFNEQSDLRDGERSREAAYFVHAYGTHPSAAVLKIKLTPRSLEIFKDACDDAGNWSGSPCLGHNFTFTKEDRGNLTQLKRAKLLTTDKAEGEEWIHFTQLGREFAAFHGIEISA